MGEALHPKLQMLLDKEAIRELKHAFAWAIDTNQVEMLADLFTEDATVNANPRFPLRGRADIRARYADVFASWKGEFSSMHSVMNEKIVVEGDCARATWCLLNVFMHREELAPLQVIGIYDEEYRRVEEAWRISSLKLRQLWNVNEGRVTSGPAVGTGWRQDPG